MGASLAPRIIIASSLHNSIVISQSLKSLLCQRVWAGGPLNIPNRTNGSLYTNVGDFGEAGVAAGVKGEIARLNPPAPKNPKWILGPLPFAEKVFLAFGLLFQLPKNFSEKFFLLIVKKTLRDYGLEILLY